LQATSLLAPLNVRLAEKALMEIQQNHHAEESGFQVQAVSTSSQVAGASYVSHVEYSVIPKGQSFSAGQIQYKVLLQ